MDESTGEPTIWPQPRTLIELSSDGCEYFSTSFLVVIGQYLHVSAIGGNGYHRHWVIDRDTGEILAILPGAGLGVSAGFVYGAGFVDGGDGTTDGPFALYRVAHDGSGFTELLVADHPIGIPLAYDGTALVSFSLPGNLRELWRADDATTTLEPVGDISGVSTWAWLRDESEILVVDDATQSMAVLDQMELTLDPLFNLVGTGSAAASNSAYILVGSDQNAIVRAAKPAYQASTLEAEVPIEDIVADDEAVVWAGDRSIFAAGPEGDDPALVWTDGDLVTELAMDSDAVYFTTHAAEGCDGVFAVLARIDRP